MTTAVTATTAQTAATGPKAAGFGADFNAFLGLLTTQLKNQDPTKAMDTQAMTQQLVQFASVEQQISMNGNLEKLIALQQAAQLTAAAPLMGRVIEVESDRLSLQDGVATLRLPAAGAAGRARITVLDAAGRTLREEEVALGAAPREWRWDGRDAAGRKQPDGAYRFAVAGRDLAGSPQPVTATVLARATAAERQGSGGLSLALGGLSVGFDAVRRLGTE
jgi:flagellar basal-body rod modification protein FlgD